MSGIVGAVKHTLTEGDLETLKEKMKFPGSVAKDKAPVESGGRILRSWGPGSTSVSPQPGSNMLTIEEMEEEMYWNNYGSNYHPFL